MEYFTLNNGLEVIFEKQQKTKVCSIYFAIKTGSVNEPEELAGVSHFLEHLLFKGKATATVIESCGGYLNAYTSLDETVFYITLPSENFEIGIKEIKNLVYNLSFSKEEVELEKNIIIEELKGGKDNPFKLLYEKIFEKTFQNIGYKRPVIGLKESIKSITHEKILEYYKNYYSPSNSTLIIVGDLIEDDVIRKVEEIFSDIKCEKNSIIELDFKENEKNNFNIFVEKLDCSHFYLGISFKLPKFNSDDFVSLDVFANFFGSGQSSYLVKKLKKEKELVLDIASYIYPMKYFSIFLITAIVSTDKDIKLVLSEIFNELEFFQKNELTLTDIEKSVLNLKSEIYYDKESCSEEAKKILFYHIITGDYKNEKIYIRKLNKITPKKIKNAVKNWLDKNFATVVMLSPVDLEFNEITSNVYSLKKNLKKRELIKLDNGIKIIFEKIKRTPIVAYKIGAFGGLRFENENNNGISYLLAKYLTKGSVNYSENEIFEQIESRGGELISFSGRNSIGISGYVLKNELLRSFEVLKDIIFNSIFPEYKLNRLKNEILGRIKLEKDTPMEYALRLFYKNIFKGHHYQFDIKGEEKNIKKFKVTEVKEFYKKIFVPENIVFSFAGDFTIQQKDEIIESLNLIKSAGEFCIKEKKLPDKIKEQRIVEKYNKNQSYIITGFIAPEHGHKDSFAMTLIKNALGNQSGRLFNNIREKLGLCYAIFPFYLNGIDGGCFGIYVNTDKKLTEKVLKELDLLIDELVENGITEEELNLARNYLIGNYKISQQKFISIAGNNFFNELYGFGLNFEKKYLQKIKTLSKDEVDKVIKKYFTSPRITLCLN